MTKFVCPDCEDFITGKRSSVIDRAVIHYANRHEKFLSREYVGRNIDRNSP